jgi:hypothetical protein
VGRALEVVDWSMMYLIHYKNLCKCYNVPPPSTTIKKLLLIHNTETLSVIKKQIDQFITNINQNNDSINYENNSIFALLCKTHLLNWIRDYQNYLQKTGYQSMTKWDWFCQSIQLNKDFKLFLY